MKITFLISFNDVISLESRPLNFRVFVLSQMCEIDPDLRKRPRDFPRFPMTRNNIPGGQGKKKREPDTNLLRNVVRPLF